MRFLVTMTALAASVGTAAVSTSARAQTYVVRTAPALAERAPVQLVSDFAGPAMPAYEVMSIVRSMGFDPASRPVLRGPVWIVRAFDNQDVLVRVAVDARSGRVVNVAEARRVASYGEPEVERYGAYPTPPASVPHGGVVYRETETTTVGPQARAYPDETYDERSYPSQGYPPANYRPTPYTPSPSVAPRASAPQPKVAARTPAAAKPAAPNPAVHAVTPAPKLAPKTAAAPVKSGKDQSRPQQQNAPAISVQEMAKAAERPGISIPAPVAHKAAPAASDTVPAETKASTEGKASADVKADDLQLVPVAPLE